jgi:MraZ protein
VVFQGEYDHSIDDKGRVIIPTKFRSLLGDRFYMTKGYSGPCIWVFTEAEWKSFSDALDRRPQLDEDTVMLKRFFTSTEAATDSQGRVAIPSKLRSYAKIVEQSPVVIVGTGSKIEIWSAAEWEKYNDNITADMISKAARGVGI